MYCSRASLSEPQGVIMSTALACVRTCLPHTSARVGEARLALGLVHGVKCPRVRVGEAGQVGSE